MLDLLKYRYFYLLLSGLIILPGLIFIALGGLKPGIDFQGGTQITVVMPKGANPTTAAVVSVVRTVTYTNSAGKKVLFDDVEAQGVTDPAYKGQQEFLIRVPDIGSDVVAQQNLLSALKKQWGDVKQVSLDSVSGTVGADTTNRAIQAVIAAAVAILLYMAFAFRKLPHPFVYGGAAIAALLHDVLVVLGLFAIMGYFFDVRIDALFVPAVLTVIGFSVHDTIVVFDRIRENMGRRTGEPYYTVVNNSLAQTLGRSLNTSLTVLLTLIALLLFGGSSIRIFVLTLLIGITSGTYSSIFNATPLAVMWETGEIPRLFGGGRGKKKPATTTPSTTRPRTVGTRAR
ncbi:MAG TPA: protein translocase subunit SecF [Chloroflexota bacterium]|nr:protein translocase subunit SecF [Chloroflexota bacterium]